MSVLQLVVQRHQAVVDLGADAAVAHVGVDAVGEVQRARAGGQVLDLAARGEDEDLVLEDVELEALHELGGVGHLALPVHELADPGQLGVVVTVDTRPFLVPPVGGDADLRDAVHRVRPDLDLQRLAVERHDRGVEALVAVALGHRDVVVELARDGPPERVHHPQGGVAVAQLLDEDADGVHVVDLAELGALALHLLGDAGDVLGAAGQLGIDACFAERPVEDGHGPLDVPLPGAAAGLELGRQLAVFGRLEDLEGEVLQLPLHLPDTQTLGQRGVDLLRLASDADLLLVRQRAQRAHVVEPVRQLDEDHPDVLGHGQEHLADVLGLLLLVRQRAELGQLGHAVDETRDVRPEPLLEVAEVIVGVFGDVVEQRRGHGHGVDPELGQDLGGGERMGDVRLTGRPFLALVRLGREAVRPFDGLEVGLRVVLVDGLEQAARRRLDGARRPAGSRARGARRRAPTLDRGRRRRIDGHGGQCTPRSRALPGSLRSLARRALGHATHGRDARADPGPGRTCRDAAGAGRRTCV